jgi:hypothetical protein
MITVTSISVPSTAVSRPASRHEPYREIPSWWVVRVKRASKKTDSLGAA